ERLTTSGARASSGSHRDRVALWQRRAGGATQRGQPRAPCATRPPRPAASSGWPSIRRGTGGRRARNPREMGGTSQAASTPSGQADRVGLGALEQGEQRVHLPLQLGDRIEPPFQLRDLGLERGDRLVAFLAPLFA